MPVSTALLRRFEDLSRDDVDYAGGKGANLGEMTAAGLPVPGGFVVGAPAYARIFCDVGGLRDRIEERLSAVDVDDTAELDARDQGSARDGRGGARARRLAQRDPRTPTSSSRATRRPAGGRPLLGDRGGHRVRVLRRHERDLPERARQPTRSSTPYAAAGPRCSAHAPSSTAPSAASAQADMDIAVVVQRQILSTRAGSCSPSTRPPATHDRLVIEGAFGLGESVVSGQVSPDRYVVDKETLAHHHARRQAQGARDRAASRRRHQHPRALGRRVTQPGAQRRRGATASPSSGSAIEGHYGTPQDTEWAFDDGGHCSGCSSRDR